MHETFFLCIGYSAEKKGEKHMHKKTRRKGLPYKWRHLYWCCRPGRIGKSTFTKRVMDIMVLPNMQDEKERQGAQDDLPESLQAQEL